MARSEQVPPASPHQEPPDFRRATVPDAKLLGYLLDLNHPRGGPKALFFHSRGFTEFNHEAFRRALCLHALTGLVVSDDDTEYGRELVVEGPMKMPDGSDPLVWTVWIMPSPGDAPRLVSAHTVSRKRRRAK
jgi:hypothetical protein